MDTLHVSVTVVELWVIWVPRSGALSVGVVAEDAETSVFRSDDILINPIEAHRGCSGERFCTAYPGFRILKD